MSDRPPDKRNLVVQNANVRVTIGYTRRTVLAGAAAATAAATVGTVSTTVPARAADPNSAQDMIDFVTLSGALTGIDKGKLAPGISATSPGSDPIDIKRDYFKLVSEKRRAAFENLLGIVRADRSAPAQLIIDKVQSDPESKFLARSIVLMWYLGAWYDPDHLKALAEPSPAPPEAFSYKVISSKAYTQGWVWRVAQAHPMGSSDMQFGYWQRKPNPERPDFIGGA
jgi:Membrane bound FAD containing D-sorbitol dehydrogenase